MHTNAQAQAIFNVTSRFLLAKKKIKELECKE